MSDQSDGPIFSLATLSTLYEESGKDYNRFVAFVGPEAAAKLLRNPQRADPSPEEQPTTPMTVEPMTDTTPLDTEIAKARRASALSMLGDVLFTKNPRTLRNDLRKDTSIIDENGQFKPEWFEAAKAVAQDSHLVWEPGANVKEQICKGLIVKGEDAFIDAVIAQGKKDSLAAVEVWIEDVSAHPKFATLLRDEEGEMTPQTAEALRVLSEMHPPQPIYALAYTSPDDLASSMPATPKLNLTSHTAPAANDFNAVKHLIETDATGAFTARVLELNQQATAISPDVVASSKQTRPGSSRV